MTKSGWGIRRKLFAAFLSVTLLVGIVSATAVWLQIRTAERAAMQEAEHLAHSFAITGFDDPLNEPAFLRQYVTLLHRFYRRDLSIVDAHKRIVADPDIDDVGKTFVGDADESVRKTIADGQTRSFVERGNGSEVKYVVVPFRKDQSKTDSPIVGAVIFEYTQVYEALTADAWRMAYLMCALGALFVLATVVIGLNVSARISRPLAQLELGVARLAAGDFDVRVPASGDDELAQLARAFNKMADALHTNHAELVKQQAELERRVVERTEQLAYLAKFDGVTGLPNRHMFHDRLKLAVDQARQTGTLLACMFVDLDRFKAVNDSYGHAMGDKLLSLLGERLKRCVRSQDVVARLGGDEFALLLSTLATAQDGEIVARKIMQSLSSPFDLDGREIYTSASIGIALCPQDGTDITSLLQKADVAMYVAKSQGRNAYRSYSPEMDEHATQRMELETRLRGALERHEFTLHYQPKASLADGTITGFEALIRWRDQGQLVPPVKFIPILEESGLILAVGDWVIEEVCRQINRWSARGLVPKPVAVNLAARQFQQADFAERVRRTLASQQIDPALIEFEITESMVMDDPQAAGAVMNALKASGVRLSLDDFGTGYSSLAYLKRFPLDELKIDRGFVNDVAENLDNASIILAVIKLAHTLQLKVVAEGVENKMQLMFLRTHGCNEMQGYYFSRPVDAEAATQFLVEDRRLEIPADEAAAAENPLVLVVDDSPEDLELMRRVLHKGGYPTVATKDPYTALRILMERNVQIVLSDHNMPRLSGVDFMASVRHLYPNTVRIVMSGSSTLDVVTKAINSASVHKFLSKNWDAARVLTEIRDAWAMRSEQGSQRAAEDPSQALAGARKASVRARKMNG